MQFNNITVTGNFGDSPRLFTTDGANMAIASIANSRSYEDRNGNQVTQTTWIPVRAYGKTAVNLANIGVKGAPVLVSGRLESRSWTDKESGEKRSRLELVVQTFEALESKAASDARRKGLEIIADAESAPAPEQAEVEVPQAAGLPI